MAEIEPGAAASLRQWQMALSRWDNEGGAGPAEPKEEATSSEVQSAIPQLTNAELVQLRVRVIALENLVIALLVEASEQEIGLAREMAAYVSPRPGSTHHPLTIQAAAQMIDLVERASVFQSTRPS